MDPIATDSFFGGTGWFFALILLGFVLAYLLKKFGIIASDDSQIRFVTWVSGIMAAIIAVSSDSSSTSSDLVSLGGKAAIFLITWFFIGIALSVGAAMGTEKADKDNSKK